MGRFGIPIIQKSIKRERILIALSTLMAISLIAFNMIGFIGDGKVASVIAGILVILAGFGCSIIYPTIMSIIGDYFLHAQSEACWFCGNGWWHRLDFYFHI